MHITESLIIMGDFNDIANIDESSPRAINRFSSARRFQDHIEACNLLSEDLIGYKFTWVRRTNGRVLLRERLDRTLLNLLGFAGMQRLLIYQGYVVITILSSCT
ncbi:hypothetical protein SLE2022_119950 [Rubroshorea leprosula]